MQHGLIRQRSREQGGPNVLVLDASSLKPVLPGKEAHLLPYNIRETGMDARATLGYTIHATLYEHSRRNTGAKLVAPGLRKIWCLPTPKATTLALAPCGKFFRRFLVSIDLPHMRFHDLRHSAATILLAMKVHPKVVQEILGHSQIAMTLDVYSHELPSMQEDVTKQWDSEFGQPVKKPNR